MSERKKPESQQPNLQQEPGEVPAWMVWVANEDKASEERQRDLLRVEIQASEARLGRAIEASVNRAIAVNITAIGVAVALLVWILGTFNRATPVAQPAPATAEISSPAQCPAPSETAAVSAVPSAASAAGIETPQPRDLSAPGPVAAALAETAPVEVKPPVLATEPVTAALPAAAGAAQRAAAGGGSAAGQGE